MTFFGRTDEVAEPASIDGLLERLARHEFDLVAVGRALLVDAEWSEKIRTGQAEKILPFSRDALKQLA